MSAVEEIDAHERRAPIMLYNWAGKTADKVLADFGMPLDTLDGADLLVAAYYMGDSSDSAFVLFRKDGRLFEVNGSNCSCYGLKDQGYNPGDYGKSQWVPEETSIASLLRRVEAPPRSKSMDDDEAMREAIRMWLNLPLAFPDFEYDF